MNSPTDLRHLALVLLALWCAGCLLLAALTLFPKTRQQVKGLWPLMISEAAILAAGTLLWFLPRGLLGIALLLAGLRIGFESGAVNGGGTSRGAGLLGAVALGAATAMVWLVGPPTSMQSALPWLALAAVPIAPFVVQTAGASWLHRFSLFPALPFVLFALAALWFDVAVVFLLSLLMVEVFDSFAVLGGRLFGRHLMVPRLSPRKTWEGFAVGLAAAMLAGGGLSLIIAMPTATVIAIASASTVAAVVGDLTASAAKRRAGVKDYPAVLTIQGGLLDIYDAWMVAAPVAVAVALLLR